MKNLFAKLDAGTRKQVVQRASIFGLLESAPGGDPRGPRFREQMPPPPPLQWGGRWCAASLKSPDCKFGRGRRATVTSAWHRRVSPKPAFTTTP